MSESFQSKEPNMKAQNVGQLLEQVSAQVIPGDVDLWPTIQPQLRPQERFVRHKRGWLVAGMQTFVIACLVFAAMFAISPEVRAQTGAVIRKIGELVFTNAIPRPQPATTPATVPPPNFPYVGHSRGMTLDEARTAVPFSFNVPTWVPGEFYADDQVGVYTTTSTECNCDVGWSVSKVWIKPTPLDQLSRNGYLRISIALSINRGEGMLDGRNWRVTTDLATLEQLDVNGRPTALLGPEGVIPAEPRLLGLSKTLMWTNGDLVYILRGSPGVPVEDLIHMAETMP